ncbi:MAG TPA: PQQ-binding-like beta-propeller repeat protein [Gemmataceae bacterium]|nr:PQQ-binding-like beta-propeller repeat protein [Gemmataceae bacterium]
MRRLGLVLTAFLASSLAGSAGSWPQFRGPGGSAVAPEGLTFPTEIGPDKNVVWKTPLPPGHSSPVVHGDRIYLTAVKDKKQLLILALDRKTGAVLWQKEAPHKGLEKIHAIGSYAQSTCVTDGSHVVSLFGSAGLFCHDAGGKQLWHVPMGPFKTEFGAGSSPLLIDGRVIVNQDVDSDSFLTALDVKTGKPIWRTDRSEFLVGYASPILWEVNGKKQIVQAGTMRVVGYDFDSGKELWTVRGMARVMNMTPAIGPDNVLYVGGWAAGADAGDKIELPTFEEMLDKHDKNKNGTLEPDEVPEGPFKSRFGQFDRDKDGHLTKAEWETQRAIFAAAVNRLVAIKPGGSGDVTKTHVLWEQTKQLPYVPSPLYYKGLLFLVKNGGFLSALDPKTGQALKYDRIPGAANYYASPVGGDGKVYLLGQGGELTVVSAEAQWRVLHRTRFEAAVFATPALVDGKIYLRTAEHLYCFGEK